MKFSQRKGLTPIREVVQIDDMDPQLRTDLWNLTHTMFFDRSVTDYDSYGAPIFQRIWLNHFTKDADELPSHSRMADYIKRKIKTAPWFEVYDLIESICEHSSDGRIADDYNTMLARNLAGYRIVENHVADITDEEELTSIADALDSTDAYSDVRHHLKTALGLYANRESPDYANSIKESISAVEAMAQVLEPGTDTLGASLKKIRAKKTTIHPALLDGWSKIYGYTSDEPGIRHSGQPAVNQDYARYFLVTCSAFVNLLISIEADQGEK